ncbi:MAG: nuclear transport factor 2 family protein [Acidimicrobiales bacterium]
MTHEPTAREAIRDVLAAYCRGIDRRDRPLVRGCFLDNATDDHGTGPRSVDDFLDWCFDLLDGYDSTFHFLGQSSFDFRSADEAIVETYGIASHRTEGGPDHRNLVTGFRYLDTFTTDPHTTDGAPRWRIQRRVSVTDWSRIDRAGDWWRVPDSMLAGRAGTDDPSYHH